MSGQIVPIGSLEPKAPRWLWHGYLLRGGINLVVGAKGIGKTSLVCWLAARASLGNEAFGGRPLRVFVDSQEDDPEVVLRPRIEAAGADLSMIETRTPGQPPWTFPRDVEVLLDYLEQSDRRGVLACVKLNVARKPPALKFASTVVAIPAVESVHRLQLVGESECSADAVFEQVRRTPEGDSETEIETAITWLLAYLADGARPTRRMVADARIDGISQRTTERARARLKCQAIHPAQVPERLAQDAYAALNEEERNAWWLALPELPDAPPEEWTT